MKILYPSIWKYSLFLFIIYAFYNLSTSNIGKSFVINENAALDDIREIYQGALNSPLKNRIELLKQYIYSLPNHPDAHVRFNVVEAMGELQDPGMPERLWKIFKAEKDPGVKESAIEGLVLTREKSNLKYFLRLMRNKTHGIRLRAAIISGEIGDRSAIPDLKAALRKERDPIIKMAMIASIAKLEQEEKADYLEYAMVGADDPQERKFAVRQILDCKFKLDENKLLDDLLLEKDENVRIWIMNILALRENEEKWVEQLKKILNDTDNEALQLDIIEILTDLDRGYEDYVYPYILNLMKDDDPDIRELAIERLFDLKKYPVTEILTPVLINDKDVIVREIAAWSMGERRESTAVPILEMALSDRSDFVRTGVVIALYKILKNMQTNDD
jgi:HEAT repeat protein